MEGGNVIEASVTTDSSKEKALKTVSSVLFSDASVILVLPLKMVFG